MAAINDIQNLALIRQIHRVLNMHYIEGLKQSEVAAKTNMSTAKVNRLIKQGKKLGMLEISIKSPYQPLLDIESQLRDVAGVQEAAIAPGVSDNPETIMRGVGAMAATLLVQSIKNGDRICISGGKGVSAVIEGLQPGLAYDVEVVPMTGCVQGKHYTDVNHVATLLADKLGGRAYQIHAPLFAETQQQRDMLIRMKAVDDVFNRARSANIALFGIGSVLSPESSYFDLHPLSEAHQKTIKDTGSVAELLGQLLDRNGVPTRFDLNSKLVAMVPEELGRIPISIGIAAGPNKVIPISALLRGRHVKALVTDENTAHGVLNTFQEG